MRTETTTRKTGCARRQGIPGRIAISTARMITSTGATVATVPQRVARSMGVIVGGLGDHSSQVVGCRIGQAASPVDVPLTSADRGVAERLLDHVDRRTTGGCQSSVCVSEPMRRCGL